MKTYKVTVSQGNTRWHNEEGRLHREDGPAVEWFSGDKSWHFNGELHRADGPALYSSADDGGQWYAHGKRHREDGPAIERADGAKFWYLHGKEYSEVDFLKEVSKPARTRQTVTIEGRDYILVPKPPC